MGELMGSQNPQGESQIKKITWRRRERALQIQEMADQGMKVREIAQYFGISRRMVQKDLRLADKINGEMVQGINPGELLGRRITRLENLYRHVMRQGELSQNENAKVGWSRLAVEVENTLIKLYQATGMITTIPTRISLEEGNPFNDPEFRKRYVALMKEAREKGVSIWGL
uniref:Helix-turn-helix domain-containing protein n=1 Tax=Desulfobacca acetoxidans TaxID=60893 RepID=A0A7C3WRN4_9BACT